MKSLALPHNCLPAVKLLQSLAASLALLLAAPVPVHAQSVNYGYDASGNRTTRSAPARAGQGALPASPASVAGTVAEASSLLPSIDTSLLRVAASAQQLPPSSRLTLGLRTFGGLPTGEHSDSFSALMEKEQEERISRWLSQHETFAEKPDAETSLLRAPSSSTASVISIPLQEGVTPTGARTYTIPVSTAYGLPFTPSVSLSYNSQGGMGAAGYGWSIGGLSAVTISNKTLYYHGEASAAQAGNPAGAFSLDGEPLVPNTAAPGVTGFTLMTPQSRVLVKPVTSGGYVTGFVAKYPDGSTATFSCEGTGAAYAYAFPVRQIEDASGEKIVFTYLPYSDNDNIYYIDEILYGYRLGAPCASIKFNYEETLASCTQYFGGIGMERTRLLSSITCKDGSTPVYSYSISYSMCDGVKVPVSVSCSRGGSTAPPLVFEYPGTSSTSASTAFSVSTSSAPFGFDPASVNYTYLRGKMVRDDFQDGLVILPSKDIYTKSGSKYVSGYGSSDAVHVYPTLSRPYLSLQTGSGFQAIGTADIDADGRDEVVKVNFSGFSGTATIYTVTVYSFNKSSQSFVTSSISATVQGSIGSGSGQSPWQREFFFGDFAGNGKSSLLILSYKKNFDNVVQGSFATLVDLEGGQCTDSIAMPYDLSVGDRKNISVFDIDGDGRAELCWAVYLQGYKAYEVGSSGFTLQATYTGVTSDDFFPYRGGSYVTDVNADGLVDLVFPPAAVPAGTAPSQLTPSDRRWRVKSFTGKTFVEDSLEVVHRETGEEFQFIDINHDGFADMVKVKNDGEPEIHLNCNGVFDSSPWCPDLTVGGGSFFKLVDAAMTDFRGMSCFVKVGSSGIKRFSLTDDAMSRRLVVKSTDSYSVELESGYSSPESGGGYTDGDLPAPSAGFARVKLPLRLLATESKHMGAGTGPGSVASAWPQRVYRYYNLICSTTGRGICGFQKVSVSDVDRGETTVFDPEAFGVPLSTERWLSGQEGSPYEVTAFSYSSWTDHYRPPRLTGSAMESVPSARTVQVTYSGYDAWDFPGTVTTETSVTDQSQTPGVATTLTETVTSVYSHQATSSSYKLGTVSGSTASTESSSVCAPSLMATRTAYTYDQAWRPLTEKVWRSWDDDDEVLLSERRLSYDSFGNIVSEKTAAHGASSFLERTYSYSADGRRLLSSTDVFGTTTSFSDYTLLGQPGKATDYRGSTTMSYDAWGRQTGLSRPDGSSETVTRAWGGDGLFTVTVSPTDAPRTVTHYDALGREVCSAVRRFDGQWQYTRTRYDYRGRVSAVSLPHRSATAPSSSFSSNSYDSYDRIVLSAEPSGRTTSWSYDGSCTTVTADGISSSSMTDAAGRVWQSSDPGGTVVRWMRIDGLPAVLYSSAGGGTTMVTYDAYGERSAISDPSGGIRTETNTWYPDGSLRHVFVSPSGTTTTSVDRYGRTASVDRSQSFSTTYAYDRHGRLAAVSSTNGTAVSYAYDGCGRMTTVTDSVPDGKYLARTFTFNTSDGTPASTVYSTDEGTVTTESYTYANGWRTRISLPGGQVVWRLAAEDDFGHATSGGTLALTRTCTYDALSGMPASRGLAVTSAGTVLQADTYVFDAATGNLSSRHSSSSSDTEYFQYDALGRLTAWSAGLNTRTAMYSTLGNPTSKSGTGYYSYGTASSPFRVTGLSLADAAAVPARSQTVSYNVLDRPSSLSEGGRRASFTYDADGERVKMEVCEVAGPDTTALLTRYYIGGRYELDVTASGARRRRLYLGGDAYSAPAVYVKDSTQAWTILAIGRDYLGSVTHVADASGTLLAQYSYDPWGRFRNPLTLVPYDAASQPEPILGGRGFSGHEHLPWFGLVNMNARMYDPLLGRFLSPDPYVQAPDFTQALNRYSYALNNPLKYTDPSGEIVWYVPVMIGAAIGAYTGASIQSKTAAFWDWKPDAWQGAISGAIVGATLGYCISGAIGSAGMTTVVAGNVPVTTNSAGLVSSMLNNGTVSIAMNAFSGANWNDTWKVGVVGLVTGMWNASGGFGMVKGFGATSDIVRLAGKLSYQMIGTAGSSIGNNWARGDNPFSKVSLGVGPVNLTLGKGQVLLQWQNNLGNIATNAFGLCNLALGGKVVFDWKNISLVYTGGITDLFYDPGYWNSGFGAHSVIGNSNFFRYPSLYPHELHHLWQSRAYGDMFLINYGLQGINAMLMGGSFLKEYNFFEDLAYGHSWWNY